MKFIIIGLGNFGSSLALKLVEAGHEVIGVDNNDSHINQLKEKVTHILKMDSTNEQAVRQLPLNDTDAVIICIGEDSGAAITTAALLKKQLSTCKIVVRSTSEIQNTIFEAMGIDEIVNPEVEYAENFANRLTISGTINTYLLDDKYEIAELKVPENFIGKTVQEADIVTNWNVSLITILRHVTEKNLLGRETSKTKVTGVISGSSSFERNDTLLVFGKISDLEAFIKNFDD